MRARDFLLEYDRSRTLGALTDRQIINRLTPRDWRMLYSHWDGREISASGVGYEFFRKYCEKAVGAIKLDMSKDNFDEDGAVGYADPDPQYAHYMRWVREFIMDLCEQADPTKKRKFAPTIFHWWYNGRGMNHLEDIYKAKEALEIYIRFKNRITGLDLNKIDFYDFANKMDEVSAIPSGSEEDRAMQQRFFDSGAAYCSIDTPLVKVVVPHDKEAAQYFGRNTRWCTSAKDGNNMFARYNKDGPLFIILFKKENVRWQWHFETEQFMDEKDEDNKEDIHKTLPQYPELMQLWDSNWRNQLEVMVEQGREASADIALKYMFEPTLDDFKMVLTGQRDARYLKGETWNLVPPTSRKDVVEYAQEVWRERYHK